MDCVCFTYVCSVTNRMTISCWAIFSWIWLFQCDQHTCCRSTGATWRMEDTYCVEGKMAQGMEARESMEAIVEESVGASRNKRVGSNSETSSWVGVRTWVTWDKWKYRLFTSLCLCSYRCNDSPNAIYLVTQSEENVWNFSRHVSNQVTLNTNHPTDGRGTIPRRENKTSG
jgi:hypothetical protein